ncbi:MAG: phosphoesterase, partial [Frankiales bacterium]|nr:phosphoesterase [Frankiales bacterium]
MRRALAAALAVLACAVPTALSAAAPAGAATATGTPRLKHVWVIELENKSFDAAFVQNSNTYLYKTLPSQGALLRQYYGIGHLSLDNYVAELSGQAPNAVTQSDCQRYQDFLPGVVSPLQDQAV